MAASPSAPSYECGYCGTVITCGLGTGNGLAELWAYERIVAEHARICPGTGKKR